MLISTLPLTIGLGNFIIKSKSYFHEKRKLFGNFFIRFENRPFFAASLFQ